MRLQPSIATSGKATPLSCRSTPVRAWRSGVSFAVVVCQRVSACIVSAFVGSLDIDVVVLGFLVMCIVVIGGIGMALHAPVCQCVCECVYRVSVRR